MNIIDKIKRKVCFIKHQFGKVNEVVSPDSYELKILKEKILETNKTILLGTSSWENNRKSIRAGILSKNINDFLNWEVIQKTMFYEAARVEYEDVKENQLIMNSIKEAKIGNPKPYYLDSSTSGNLIHHAYSLNQFLKKISFEAIENVVEFGGGYGSMCRLFRNMRYKKQYIIFDLPEFSALQEFYLGKVDSDYLNNTVLTGDESIFESKIPGTLFIATWSLSEMPLSLRKKLLKDLNFDHCLIAFQSSFDGIDNISYFDDFKDIYKNMNFKVIPIEHLPGHFYLVGIKK